MVLKKIIVVILVLIKLHRLENSFKTLCQLVTDHHNERQENFYVIQL